MQQDTITGYSGINTFVHGALVDQADIRLFFIDVFPMEHDGGGLPSLNIDRVALQLVTDRFVRQFKLDCEHPAILEYYKHSLNGYWDNLNDNYENQPEYHFTPNALAVLMDGIKEYAYGLNQEEERILATDTDMVIMRAAMNYGGAIYRHVSRAEMPDFKRHDDMEFLVPAKKKNTIDGLSRIEHFIQDALRVTREKRLADCFSLTALKEEVVIESTSANLPSLERKETRPRQNIWSVDRDALRKIFDAAVDQIHKDMDDHGALFAERPLSPAARAILLHGIECAAKDMAPPVTEDRAFFMRVLEGVFASIKPVSSSILQEAKFYGECINHRMPSHEIISDDKAAAFRAFRL